MYRFVSGVLCMFLKNHPKNLYKHHMVFFFSETVNFKLFEM